MSTKIIQLKDMNGNILLPQAYSASHDSNGNDFGTVYATKTLVNTKADDNSVVHLTGNEVITSVKTINTSDAGTHLILKSNVIDSDIVPVEQQWDNYIDFRDKDDMLIGRIFTQKNTVGSDGTVIGAWNGNTAYYMGIESDGYAFAPTPSSASDNSTKIATTAWVNSHIDVNPNVVRTSGNQTIAGAKTYISSVRFQNNDVEQMVDPEVYNERCIFALDKNNIRIGSIGFAMMTDGRSRTYIEASKNINGTQTYNIFENYITKTGELSTYLQGQRLRAWIKETYSSGTNWYRIWSDGWIEQGGLVDYGSYRSSSSAQAVTFLKAFKDTNYGIMATQRDADMNNDGYAHGCTPDPVSCTTTGFNMHCYSPGSGDAYRYIRWYAYGY